MEEEEKLNYYSSIASRNSSWIVIWILEHIIMINLFNQTVIVQGQIDNQNPIPKQQIEKYKLL